MDERSIRIRRGDLKWPPRCAVCLDHPTESITLSRTVVTRVFLLASVIPRQRRAAKIKFPVCKQHHLFARAVSAIGRQDLLRLLILTVAFIWLGTGITAAALYTAEGNADHAAKILLYALIPAAILAVYFWSRGRMPVRIIEVGKHSMTLSFNNRMYADFFEQENRELMPRRNPTSKARLW